MKFYQCEHCGNIISYLHSSGVPIVCCGEKMKELVPNSTAAAKEKHLPVVTVSGSTVKVTVGAVTHPMSEEHSIGFICLETKKGSQTRWLSPTGVPEATFEVAAGDEPVAVYEWCNLHGLWMTEI